MNQTTQKQHQFAIQINAGIDGVRRWLTQVYADTKQLVRFTEA